MSTLLLNELATELFQQVVPSQNINLKAVYLGLYVALAPGGTVTLEIRDTNDKLIESSNSLTVSALSTLDYAHGLFRFDIDTPLRKDESYRFTLVGGGGYTATATDFVGWKRDFDFTQTSLRRTKASYTQNVGYNAPFDYLIVEKKNVQKGMQ